MTRDLKSGLFFLCVSVLTLYESLRVGLGTLKEPGSGLLAFMGGIALCALSISLIRKGWGDQEGQKPHSRRVLVAIVSILAYSLLMDSLGFIVATFLLVGVLFHLGKPRKWWVLIVLSASTTLVAYVVFGRFLSVYFPRGILPL
jgi:putative tricarboxylic transport membrane protein